VSVSPGSWIMDVGQSKTFTANPTGGSGSYTGYQWYVGGSAQSGQTASTFSYSPASSGSPLITVTVTDSLGATSAQSTAPSVTVNSALVASTVTPTPATVDQGQTSSLSSTAVSTGTSPYSYQWLQKAPGAISYSPIGGATSSSYSFVTSGSTTIGTWSFELQVTDSASTPATVTSTTVSVTVNASPTVSIAPIGPFTMDVGQTQTFTATSSGGSGTIHYQWYADGGAVGTDSASYSYTFAGTSHSVTCKVTDSASTPVTSPASNAVSVNQLTITVTQGANGVIAPGTTTVDYGDSQAFTITPNSGYYITSITTDAGSVTVTSPSGQTVSFTNIVAAHTITATYALTPTPTPTPVPTAAPTSAPTSTSKPTATPTPTAVPSPTPTPSATASTSPSPTASPNPTQSSLPIGVICGVAVAVAIVVIVAVVLMLRKRGKGKS
jgi:hypothetical protein